MKNESYYLFIFIPINVYGGYSSVCMLYIMS